MGKRTWTTEQEECLKELYLQKKPIKEIQQTMSIKFGRDYSFGGITSKANSMGLSTMVIKPNNPKFKALYQDYDWCYQKFVEEGLNHQEMADELKCTKRVIEKWCQEHNHIDTYVRMHNKKLNNIQHDLVVGSLLGDGHIDKREDYPLFIVSHAENQKDYLYYKYSLMKNLCEMTPMHYPESVKIVNGNKCNCQGFVRFNTRTYDCFRSYRNMSKVELMQQLNDYSLAIWMLDDGHCCDKGYWELCAPFNTDEERKFLKDTLLDKFNIIAYEQKDNRYFRFHSEDSVKITDIIMKHIPHNLDIIQYKILNKDKYKHCKEGDT